MDYENKDDASDDNTIIYGHNRYHNSVMFGTLGNTLNKKWYTNPENQIITFDTLYDSYKYQIFSIYVVGYTTDYINTNYPVDSLKKEFIKTIKDRSIYDFKVPVNTNSKILTLSTCKNNGASRLVVHAVLIEE